MAVNVRKRGVVVMPKLDFFIGCSKCKIECEPTNDGIICAKCGDYISNKEIDEMGADW